jgi:phospholipid transport system substrate-binding protein
MGLMATGLMAFALTAHAGDAPALQEADAKAVRAAVEPAVNKVLDILRDKKGPKEEGKAKIFKIVEETFDLPLMAGLTLGPKRKDADPAELKAFTEAFVKTIEESYYDKLQLYSDETVKFEDPAPGEKGKVEMNTVVISKGQRYDIKYKLYKKKDAWKAYDFEIEGVSLVTQYKNQHTQFLEKNPLPKLTEKLKDRSFEAPEDLKKAGKGKSKG